MGYVWGEQVTKAIQGRVFTAGELRARDERLIRAAVERFTVNHWTLDIDAIIAKAEAGS